MTCFVAISCKENKDVIIPENEATLELGSLSGIVTIKEGDYSLFLRDGETYSCAVFSESACWQYTIVKDSTLQMNPFIDHSVN